MSLIELKLIVFFVYISLSLFFLLSIHIRYGYHGVRPLYQRPIKFIRYLCIYFVNLSSQWLKHLQCPIVVFGIIITSEILLLLVSEFFS